MMKKMVQENIILMLYNYLMNYQKKIKMMKMKKITIMKIIYLDSDILKDISQVENQLIIIKKKQLIKQENLIILNLDKFYMMTITHIIKVANILEIIPKISINIIIYIEVFQIL